MRDLLEHHGLDFGAGPLSEEEALVLAGGLSVLFSEGAGHDHAMYLLGRCHTLEADLCANLGVACEQHSTEDGDIAWSWVQAEVDEGRPVMVWADIGHLDYLDVRMHNSNHDLIVVGYDLPAGQVLVADHALPDTQRCSLESFAAARASDDFPGPHGNRTWFMRWPSALPPADDAVAVALRGAAAHLLHGEREIPHTTGLAAISELSSAITGWAELDDLALRERLRRLWFCVEAAGTGGGFFRALWAGGLQRFADLLADRELRRLGDLYAELAGEWSALATESLGRDRRQALPSAVARVAHIDRLEEEGARGLAAWSRPRSIDTTATEEGTMSLTYTDTAATADEQLTYEATVPRELVHKASVHEVLLTDARQVDEDLYICAGELPRTHSFYSDGFYSDGVSVRYDAMLPMELKRQGGVLVAHRWQDVPHGYRFVFMGIDLAIQHPEALAIGGAPARVVMTMRIVDRQHRGDQLTGYSLDTAFSIDGVGACTATGTVMFMPRPVYEAMRRKQREAHGLPPEAPQRSAGRRFPVAPSCSAASTRTTSSCRACAATRPRTATRPASSWTTAIRACSITVSTTFRACSCSRPTGRSRSPRRPTGSACRRRDWS